MNFYWRQTIVGLLRYAAEQVPEITDRSLSAARELDRTLTSPWLEEAFSVFQDAALRSRNPVYVTGAYYSMRALEEVTAWEEKAGGPIHVVINERGDRYALPGGPDTLPPDIDDETGVETGAGAHAVPPTPDETASRTRSDSDRDHDRDATDEAQRGILELFERIRRGATLEEALALFPLEGEETSPD